MPTDRPQYYQNNLKPVEISEDSLRKTLKELRIAAKRGVDLVQNGSPPGELSKAGLFNGPSGPTLMFLRLDQQSRVLAENSDSVPDFRNAVNERILPHAPNMPLAPGRLSPIGSSCPLTEVMLRILSAATSGSSRADISKDDIRCLHDAVKIALSNGPMIQHGGRIMGGDELMYGRSGLLWAVLNIRAHTFDEESTKSLAPVLGAVPRLIDVIIDAGRQGSKEYSKKGSRNSLPLMWMWSEGSYYLGAVHGMTGILSVLLACRPDELKNDTRDYFPLIADTITGLCYICINNGGHLPSTIPPRSSRPSPLVQICHGSPGILILLACARKNTYLFPNYWSPTWDQATLLATERVWEQGLLSKGGSLCHGLAGNAWPLLLLHDCFEYDTEHIDTAKRNFQSRSQMDNVPDFSDKLTADYFFSRALAFLLHARESRPYSNSSKSARDFRMPDSPYCLFEGLAGTVCAWTEACATIEARLRKIELDRTRPNISSASALKDDGVFRGLVRRPLGFPGLQGDWCILNMQPTLHT